jgi:bifunctional UDP-N-acetylglucosamine pyrophosphorylase / glucosamine-1-phosphate N-acetyltransferase
MSARYLPAQESLDCPNMTESLAVVILAAGQGTRMKSALPKVLHTIGGRPMLGHVLAAAQALNASRIAVVTSPGAESVAAFARQAGAEVCVQERQLGTAHAVLAAEKALAGFGGKLLVLFGDTPLMTVKTLQRLVARAGEGGADIAALAFRAKDPTGYGRMIAEGGMLLRIVEHKDASEEERRIDLCNAGSLAGPCRRIFELLHGVGDKNAQGEFYLTDVFSLARADGQKTAIVEGSEAEMAGVNSRAQLAEAETVFQSRRRAELMEDGVSFAAPETVFLQADTIIEPDARIGPYIVFGPGAIVRRGAEIRPFCHIEGAQVGEGAIVGPFARLRPGAVLEESVHVGNFVEIKNARLEKGAKANHLAYVGDARVGAGSNIGAGTITCNYDGVNKHRTDIGAGVFVGSDSTLVAPVKIGDGAYIAAGSTITENVEPGALALGRSRQMAKPGLAVKLRDRLNANKKKEA